MGRKTHLFSAEKTAHNEFFHHTHFNLHEGGGGRRGVGVPGNQ